ncbi:DNA cytosine methyltransferase [Bdellovibrio bacteriovorus]|uniref:DNA cytosine methyltransferase n=1 Tax=Bdellovibrio bacteriovorus TaxID=959 RepID=UPI0035A583B5
MLNGLDLFTGIGGLTDALSPWVHPVTYCERDRYAQSVLLSLMASGTIVNAPIWDDVSSLDPQFFNLQPIDIIYGGFPCQDISTAGAGAGLEGKRSGLFFEIVRLVRELRPRFVFLENVPAITVRGLDRVLMEFNALGYDCRWTIVSAAEFGAPHLRERWFLLAHANGDRGGLESRGISGSSRKNSTFTFPSGSKLTIAGPNDPEQLVSRTIRYVENALADPVSEGLSPQWNSRRISAPSSEGPSAELKRGGRAPAGNVANPESERFGKTWGNKSDGSTERSGGCSSQMANAESVRSHEGRHGFGTSPADSISNFGSEHFGGIPWWAVEPNVGRVAHGIPHRVDRIKGLGNAVVPLQAREAFKRLSGLHEGSFQ